MAVEICEHERLKRSCDVCLLIADVADEKKRADHYATVSHEQRDTIQKLIHANAELLFALHGAKVTIEALFDEQGRDASNNDNYCRVCDAIKKQDAT